MGYHRAGFDEIIGIDLKLQKHYPFTFIQADALHPPVDLGMFDAIHASPPCQAYSSLRHLVEAQHGPQNYPELIDPTRELLEASGLPWVIENVMTAPLGRTRQAVVVCPKAIGAGDYRRHRRFEISFPMLVPPCPGHAPNPAGMGSFATIPQKDALVAARLVGGGAVAKSQTQLRRGGELAGRVAGHGHGLATAASRVLLGIDWMNRDELSQAIPPAYTQFIGERLIESLR